MTARWRKSSRSGYAGENCVEIALSIDRDVKAGRTRPDRHYERPDEKRPAPAWARSRA
jgi:Domain of unknown function (DUF397)